MTEGEFAELFASMVQGSLPAGWEIVGLDIGEITVKADYGQVFCLTVSIADPE